MRHTRIKKVITQKGKTIYYVGDGFWFGRTSKAKAEDGLNSGKYFLWETVVHQGMKRLENFNPKNLVLN